MHHQAFEPSCSNCHTTENAGGTDNSSFCSNSACHGSAWENAGFDAPELREIILAQLPPTPTPMPTPEGQPVTYTNTIGALLQVRCASCHGANGIQGLDLTSYQTTLAGGQSGPAVVPGNPQASLLVQKQSGEQPHFGQFAPEELELVTNWVADGAPE
jgi:mono/diheme cytochrome c family protein